MRHGRNGSVSGRQPVPQWLSRGSTVTVMLMRYVPPVVTSFRVADRPAPVAADE